MSRDNNFFILGSFGGEGKVDIKNSLEGKNKEIVGV